MINWKARQRRALGLDASDEVTKTYTITGNSEIMARLDKHLAFIQRLGSIGHSCVAGISVDGDGSDRIKIAEDMPKIDEGDVETKGTYPAQYEYVP